MVALEVVAPEDIAVGFDGEAALGVLCQRVA